MVLAGMWSDRRGPALPLMVSTAVFSLGLLVCGTAPTMEVLVVGRVVQGIGAGALIVGLYVVVGLVFPAHLQPSVFASFAAAWVLPALFGPAVAAWVADRWGWRWVFTGTVALVALAALLVVPALRRLPEPRTGDRVPVTRLAWAVVGAVAVLVLELSGSTRGALALAAVAALALVVLALRRLLPPGTLLGRRGLPAVIGTRGLMSAAFFCGEAYIVFVLQRQWGLTPALAGLALTAVGVVWATASQLQARLGPRISHTTAMLTGASLVLAGLASLGLTVVLDGPAVLAGASYVLAGAGMGLGYPRTSVAMLAASDDSDRGFNSSALTVSDSLGAALALSVSGIVFAAAGDLGLATFPPVFALATVIAVLGVWTAARTAPPAPTEPRPPGTTQPATETR
jgi:MFS family permease